MKNPDDSRPLALQDSVSGSWVIIDRDHVEVISEVHPDEMSALRRLNVRQYGAVVFVRYGESVAEMRERVG